MRIAVISRIFSKAGGGAESYSVALAQELAARHEIHVFSQESNQPVVGVTYHSVFCLGQRPRWLNQLFFAFSTWRKTRTGFDVVHSHENTWHGQIQTIHVRPLRFNLLVGRRGLRLLGQWIKVFLSPRLLAYVWLEAGRFKPMLGRQVVATSQGLRDDCAQAYPHSSSVLSVIPPGTYTPIATKPREVYRAQLNLQKDGRLLLFVANDYARKGLDTLLEAMTCLPVDVSLAIAGNTRQAARYILQAERMGLASRVHFLGSLENLSTAYFAADCLAHPTREDSFAMVVLEAMAHGLPVVVSGPAHCGISRELTNEEEALLLTDPADAKQLAQLIEAVLEKPVLAEQLRRHGLAFAHSHSWENAALQYEALYEQAVSIR
jgi:UDP-glucose:(heptosyl)LPS alpha-1,3-glucosyltransferase